MENRLRWDTTLRYRIIEIIGQWEGRLTTKHLMETFHIGRQQASRDINSYLAEHPNNLVYDRSLKGYQPSPDFVAYYTTGEVNEYLNFLRNQHDLSRQLDIANSGSPNIEVLSVPKRNVNPDVVRVILHAIRESRRVELVYHSMNSPEGEDRMIAPHSLVYSGLRWHARAFCEKNREYRDFVIDRMMEVELEDKCVNNSADDHGWHNQVEVILEPADHLLPSQQALIAREYQMKNNELKVIIRQTLIAYALEQMQVIAKDNRRPTSSYLQVKNIDAIQDYLR